MGDFSSRRDRIAVEHDFDPIGRRNTIYRLIVEAGEPVELATIASRLGLQKSIVADHIDQLCDAGLIVEQRTRAGERRRATAKYRSGTPTTTAPEPQGPYLRLSELLVRVLREGRDPEPVAREAGREMGSTLASGDPTDHSQAIDKLRAFLVRQGFQPRQEGSVPDIAFVLGRCPFEEVASANPRLVCGLHQALAEGMAEGLGASFEVTRLVALNPKTAGCRLQLHAKSDG